MSEHDRARAWREHVVKLTRPQLANRTGYCVETIANFERGMSGSGRPLNPRAWQKYRLACAAIHVGVRDFNWEHTKCLG